jgi:hypothetical protein
VIGSVADGDHFVVHSRCVARDVIEDAAPVPTIVRENERVSNKTTALEPLKSLLPLHVIKESIGDSDANRNWTVGL